MIVISQGEFEEKIQELIDGVIPSKTKLAKMLQTDIRTLENKIQELAGYNIDLYMKYRNKFEYKQKSREDIDFEALIIEIIKNNMSNIEAMQIYGVGERTIRRHVNDIEKENPELIALYRSVKQSLSNNSSITHEEKEKIEQLVRRPVKIGERNEQRRKYLEELEAIYNSRIRIVGNKAAAVSMGISPSRMYKLLNELYRIRIEENTINFKQSFRVEGINFEMAKTRSQNNMPPTTLEKDK